MGLGIPYHNLLEPTPTHMGKIYIQIQVLKIIYCQKNRKNSTLPYGKGHVVLKSFSNDETHFLGTNQIFRQEKFVATTIWG